MKKLLILILLVVTSLSVKSQEIEYDNLSDITVYDENDKSIHNIIMATKGNIYVFCLDSVLYIYTEESIINEFEDLKIQKFRVESLSFYNKDENGIEDISPLRAEFKFVKNKKTGNYTFVLKLDENIFSWKVIETKDILK